MTFRVKLDDLICKTPGNGTDSIFLESDKKCALGQFNATTFKRIKIEHKNPCENIFNKYAYEELCRFLKFHFKNDLAFDLVWRLNDGKVPGADRFNYLPLKIRHRSAVRYLAKKAEEAGIIEIIHPDDSETIVNNEDLQTGHTSCCVSSMT